MLILGAIRQNPVTKSATDKLMEIGISDWLKYAGDREGGRKRRAEKQLMSANQQCRRLSDYESDI